LQISKGSLNWLQRPHVKPNRNAFYSKRFCKPQKKPEFVNNRNKKGCV
jgi:hypothetical protein